MRRIAGLLGLLSVAGFSPGAAAEQIDVVIDPALAEQAGVDSAQVEESIRSAAGAQINVLWLKVYGHLNVAFDDTYGGHLGVRVAL
jgi:hypothetical protein